MFEHVNMNKYINKYIIYNIIDMIYIIYTVSIWIVVIDINLRDIEGVVLAIRVLSVIVNNRLLVILILIIIMSISIIM